MNFETEHNKNEAVVKTKVDKLDASNASDLKAEITLLNKQGVNKLVIDMKHTKYCDSSGLSAILMANRLCKDTNGQFVLCGLQENVLKLIQIAQLDKVLVITEDQNTALENIRK
jgi:anti-sigma B factor antagonist